MRSFSQQIGGDEPINGINNGMNGNHNDDQQQNGTTQRFALRRGTSQPPGSFIDREREREGRGVGVGGGGGVNEDDVWSSGMGFSGGSLRVGSRIPGEIGSGSGSVSGSGAGAGVIGGSRYGFDSGGGGVSAALKSRWSGVLDEGVQTRSSSFSAGENRMGSTVSGCGGMVAAVRREGELSGR